MKIKKFIYRRSLTIQTGQKYFFLKNLQKSGYPVSAQKYRNLVHSLSLSEKSLNNQGNMVFIIEIYKGRTNKFESFLNLENDGFYYEFLYMAKKEENLIVNQKIILNKKKCEYMHFNTIEKFENSLKGRLCIINVPEQILDEKAENEIIKDNYNSFKYLIIMYDNHANSISKFKLELIDEKKSPY